MTAKMNKFKNTIDKGLYLLANLYDDQGSIVMTGVPQDPSQVYGMGKAENWKCIKKEWKLGYRTSEQGWQYYKDDTSIMTWQTKYAKDTGATGISRIGNGISIRLMWSNLIALDDGLQTPPSGWSAWTTPIVICNLAEMGLNGIPYDAPFLAYSDAGESIGEVYMASSKIYTLDWVWKATKQNGPQTCYSVLHFPNLPPSLMKDEFCDIWYWKRIS